MRSCHDGGIQVPVPEGARQIVLAGNPNSGKSVFFNYLTGLYVDVSNYPGTTLEISSGKFGGDVLMDTPGVYGLSSFNDEERIARDIILGADLVINVVNAVYDSESDDPAKAAKTEHEVTFTFVLQHAPE